MSDYQEVVDKLLKIENRLESIDSALNGQLGGSEGMTYSAQQVRNALTRIEQLANKIEENTGAINSNINIALWVLILVVVVHVVHHW